MSINPKEFDKNYYYNVSLGFETFIKSGGLNLDPKVKAIIDNLSISKNSDVLEIGCARGDFSLYLAKSAKSVVGIDYSTTAIKIAKEIRKKYPKKIQNKTRFYVMDATKLKFKDNSYDLVILIDTFDHLNKKEQKKLFFEITRVLRNGGRLYLRTCTNKILLNYTYKYYLYPANKLLTWVDKKIKKVRYDSLPKNPRPKEERHVTESSYLSIRKILKENNFSGSIAGQTGFLKEGKGIRTTFYNFIVTLYPLSKYMPFSILFAYAFVCDMRLDKSNKTK
jgi:ubiquinone/menaquinone biosynthesis C-methylase UbiE